MTIVHQRETVAFLDQRAKSIYPAIGWLDERARSNVTSFSKAIGVETIHRITGRYPDVTPTIYRLDWMRQHEPELSRAPLVLPTCSAISCSDWRAVLFGPVG